MNRSYLVLCALIVTYTATSAPAGEPIGISVCDDYISKTIACVSSKVPKEAIQQDVASLELMRDMWRQMLDEEGIKPELEKLCRVGLEDAKEAYTRYGCKF